MKGDQRAADLVECLVFLRVVEKDERWAALKDQQKAEQRAAERVAHWVAQKDKHWVEW